jgi:hypothetical protein
VQLNSSLGIALGAKPTNATIAIHPVIDIGFALKAGNFSLGSAPGYSATIVHSSSDLRTGLKVTFTLAMTHNAGTMNRPGIAGGSNS